MASSTSSAQPPHPGDPISNVNILGVSCFFHDAAACLLEDGEVIAAASEERFSRQKHDPGFPAHAIGFCLERGGIGVDQVDYLAFYDKPIRKFDRILTTYLSSFPRSREAFLKALPVWLKKKLRMRDLFREELEYDGPILFSNHHLSHAASAFLVSPFREAAVLTVDGVGEWDTASYGIGRDGDVELLKEMRFPHSLGLLYSAVTYYLGFRVNSGEYKVMGLAPYGEPRYVDEVLELVDVQEDGSFTMNLKYFAYHYGLRMTSRHFAELFGGPRRAPESPLEQKHKDIAASIQAVTEEILLRMANHLHRETGLSHLCMAGGVALNSVANGRILRETPFEEIFIQPAAGDAGGAVGAASFVHHALLGNERDFQMEHVYLGPEYDSADIRGLFEREGAHFREYAPSELIEETAGLIADGKIVGWYQGRMEFGPRALGNRSILADPRDPRMKDEINRRVKFREAFRPFAPSVLEERAAEYFHIDRPSPYMLLVVRVRDHKKGEIPSATHVDGTARIQTVSREQNPMFYGLIERFGALTGCPVLINTSFNVRGEPIVCTPKEALDCFRKTGLDYLIAGNVLVEKESV